jgi:uncharacterized damage-inducible protein DinB
MTTYLRRCFDYDNWANHALLKYVQGLEKVPASSLRLLGHVLAVEHLWMDRLLQRPAKYPIWPEFSLEQCSDEADRLPGMWAEYLRETSEDELRREVSYHNSKGELWNSRREDILIHAIMHSVHHRGQIAADLRAAGLEPPYLDYIHATRQGLVE